MMKLGVSLAAAAAAGLATALLLRRRQPRSVPPPSTNLGRKDLIVSDAVPVHDAALNYFDARQDEEPTISFESPTDYNTVELANHALQPQLDGCDEEEKGLLCIKDEEDVTDGEHGQKQLAEVLEEANQDGCILDLVEDIGNKNTQLWEHARKPGDGGSIEDGEEPEAKAEQTSASAIEFFHGGGYAEAEEEQVLEDVHEEGDEAAGVCELFNFDAQQDGEPTISFESPTDYDTVELANHALQPVEDGCEDNSHEAEEEKRLLCIKDEDVQDQLAENVALEEVLEEGNKIIQFGEHAPMPRDGWSVEAEEKQVLEDGSEEGDEAAGVCELFKVRGQEEGFRVGRDSKAGEEDVSQKVQEDVKNGELIKLNGQEDPLVNGDDLEDEEVKDMCEEDEVGVKGDGSVVDCLFGGFDSKDEVISLVEWGNFEEEENCLADWGYSEDKDYSLAKDVSKVGVGDAEGCEPVGVLDRDNNLVEWGNFVQEGDAIEEWQDISKDDESVDLCNGDGVLADRVDAIDAGGGGYEEEEVKEEAYHKVVEDIPKIKEREVFVGGLSCDSGEADLVKVLDVKILDQTVFFTDPITKNNKGFAFVQTEADLGKVLNQTIFFPEPTTKNNNGSTFLQSPNDDQASLGLSKLKDLLVNGMPYGVAPSQDREHHEEIMDAKNEGSLGCIPVPGWATSVLQPGSFYNLPQNVASTESYWPSHMVSGGDIHGFYAMQGGTGMMEFFQGQPFMSFAPMLADHGAISGSYQLVASTECYYPTPTVAGGNIHGLYAMQGGNEMANLFQGQPFMGFAPTLADHGAIIGSNHDIGGEVCWSSQVMSGAAGLCPQPQYSGVNVTSYWPNSEFLSCSANQEGYCCPVGTLGGYCGYVGNQEGCWGLRGGSDIAVCAC